MTYFPQDDGKRIPDDLWVRMEPCLKSVAAAGHPLGCHRRRIDDRVVMDAVLFVLRTGCYWNALSATGLCSSSTAHRRFTEWKASGVFETFRRLGLTSHAFLRDIAWPGIPSRTASRSVT